LNGCGNRPGRRRPSRASCSAARPGEGATVARSACLRAYRDFQGTIIRVAADPVGNALGVIERRSLIEVKDTLVIGDTIVIPMKIEEI
jgi:hypothetical protein